jgi:hypothetical protein
MLADNSRAVGIQGSPVPFFPADPGGLGGEKRRK